MSNYGIAVCVDNTVHPVAACRDVRRVNLITDKEYTILDIMLDDFGEIVYMIDDEGKTKGCYYHAERFDVALNNEGVTLHNTLRRKIAEKQGRRVDKLVMPDF